MIKRWHGLTSFLEDGGICLTNNEAERALRGLPSSGNRGSSPDRRADRAAFMPALIMSAKLNDVDQQAWLPIVLAHIADTPVATLVPRHSAFRQPFNFYRPADRDDHGRRCESGHGGNDEIADDIKVSTSMPWFPLVDAQLQLLPLLASATSRA